MANEIHSQPWLIEMAIKPKSSADRERLGIALAELMAEDSSFHASVDPESGQIFLRGMDDLHLDTKVGILKHTHKIEVAVGAPRVAYRETITLAVKIDYTYKKQIGSAGEFARVIFEIEPNEKGWGCAFTSKVIDGAVPERFIPGVEGGFNSVMSLGVVAGFPFLDVKVVLVDGAFHEDDSSVTAFEIASRVALRDGLHKAGVVLLEPVMKVEVETPENYLGGVIGDLNSRRGHVIGTSGHDHVQIVTALAPLAHMFGYADSLRSISQSRATYIMHFDHYASVHLPDGDPRFPPAIGMRT